MVRQNCVDIVPRSIKIDSLELLSHNLDNLIFDGRVFDRHIPGQDMAGLAMFCRGDNPIVKDGIVYRAVTDAKVKHSPINAMEVLGQVLLGLYDANQSLVEKHDLGEVPVSLDNREPSVNRYVSLTFQKGEFFDLRVDLGNLLASLVYAANLPSMSQSAGDPDLTKVSGLRCYKP